MININSSLLRLLYLYVFLIPTSYLHTLLYLSKPVPTSAISKEAETLVPLDPLEETIYLLYPRELQPGGTFLNSHSIKLPTYDTKQTLTITKQNSSGPQRLVNIDPLRGSFHLVPWNPSLEACIEEISKQ